jgi:hypothetical protein
VRDAGGVGDFVDGDLVVVPVTEDLEGGGEELLPALSGSLGCQGTRGDGVSLDPVDSESTPSSRCPRPESRW